MNSIKRNIKTFSNLHFKSDNNVAIFSCPRSGSTWLMELIWSQPGFKTINEPLNVRGQIVRNAIGVKNFKDIYEPNNKQKIIQYFREIAKGKKRFLNPSPLRKFYKPFTNRIVYKIINGGETIIDDIAEVTQSKKVVFIRHPFPVALSRKQLPRIDVLTDYSVTDKFGANQQKMMEKIFSNNDNLEMAVLSWCIQNKLMLMHCTNALVITYEQLVVDPQPIITKLSEFCDLPRPNRILKQLNVPSAVTVQSKKGTFEQIETPDRAELIEKWRNYISKEKADELWEIVNAFDIGIYSNKKTFPKTKFNIN